MAVAVGRQYHYGQLTEALTSFQFQVMYNVNNVLVPVPNGGLWDRLVDCGRGWWERGCDGGAIKQHLPLELI